MKKILTILGTLTLTASMSASVISCGQQVQPEDEITYPEDDLRSIITVTDLGLIKDSEVSNGDYFSRMWELILEKNPKYDPKIQKIDLGPKRENIFEADGLNVLVGLIGYNEWNEIIPGEVTVTFQLEPIDSASKGSIIDKKYSIKENIGELFTDDINTSLSWEKVYGQILDALSKTNPKIRALMNTLPSVISDFPGSAINRETYRILIAFDLENTDYDSRLINLIYFRFTLKEI